MIIKFLISKLIIIFFISISHSKEIKISSESLLIDRENNISTFSGSVYVEEKDMEIWADKIIVKFSDNEEKVNELSFADELKKGPIQNSENNTIILAIIVGVIIAGIIGGVVFKLKKN